MRISDWSSDVCSSDLARIDLETERAIDAEVVPVGDKDEGTPVRGRAEAGDDGDPIGGDLKPVEALEVGGVAELRAILESGRAAEEIGRASSRERVCQYEKISVGACYYKKKKIT